MNADIKKELKRIDNNTDDEAICSWCGEIYNKSDLKEELDLGLLCDSCIRAIESRGETLYFKN